MSEIVTLASMLLALFYGAAVIGGIAFRSLYERSPGLAALLFPFSILFVSGSITFLQMLSGVLSLDAGPVIVLAEYFRMLNGLGWFLLCRAHLKLHGILGIRRHLAAPVIIVTGSCVVMYVASSVFFEGSALHKTALVAGRTVMSATALFAALTAIISLRKGIRLWPSSRAGVRMAIFALVAYPVSLLAERSGMRLPFLDSDHGVFEQLYPLFMAAFATLAIPALVSKAKGMMAEPGDRRAALSLTEREREVAMLLRDGKSLKEIASDLSVSVATVKSHSNSLYKKLDISSRKELALVRFE